MTYYTSQNVAYCFLKKVVIPLFYLCVTLLNLHKSVPRGKLDRPFRITLYILLYTDSNMQP